MIMQNFRVHGVRVEVRCIFDWRAGQTRKPCQHENGRPGYKIYGTRRGEAGCETLRGGARGASKFHAPHISGIYGVKMKQNTSDAEE